MVINCAANVKHFVKDDLLDRVNYHGVQNLIGVCLKNNMKLVHISTLSVGGNMEESRAGVIYENMLYMVVTTTASAFTSFDTVKMMTNGGPDNATNLIAFYIYQQGLGFNQYGRAMAAAVILLLISGALAIINFTVFDKRVHYQ